MKKFIFSLFLVAVLSGFVEQYNDVYPYSKNDSFSRGEVIRFKMTYGFFTIGKGMVQIQPDYINFNNRPCFKVDITGKTVGMVDWVADIDNRYGAYVDTVSILPLQFYRKQREGNYKKDEWTNFNHEKKKIEVTTLDNKTGKLKEPIYYDAPEHVRDMVAGFLYLRVMNFSKLKAGDTVTVKGFFEDEFFKLKIVFQGRETIKIKAGHIRTLVFKPVMPKNKIFDGENSITAWFSDDKNRIPVKINADLFIGSGGVELTEFSGLKNPLNFVKK